MCVEPLLLLNTASNELWLLSVFFGVVVVVVVVKIPERRVPLTT